MFDTLSTIGDCVSSGSAPAHTAIVSPPVEAATRASNSIIDCTQGPVVGAHLESVVTVGTVDGAAEGMSVNATGVWTASCAVVGADDADAAMG